MRQALSNKAVNFLNLHSGLQTFANILGHIFVGVYLYEVGIPLFGVYLVMAVSFLIRLCIRPLAMKLIFRMGLRKSVIFGTVIYSTLYLSLGKVEGVNIWLLIFIIVSAIIDVLYWLPYHTYFSMLGDLEHRGKQIGVREGIIYFASFLAPVTGGILINFAGFWTAFIVAAVCMLIAAVPLRYTPEVPIENNLSSPQSLTKVSKVGLYVYSGEGFYYFSHLFTWPLVLFIMVDDYITFGGLLSLAVLFQIVGSLWIGHIFDAGDGKKIYPIGLAIVGLTILGRTFFAFTIPIIIFLDALFMIGHLLYQGITNSAFYNTSKKSTHPLWFQFYAESGWDIGSTSSCLLIAGLLYFGTDLRHIMILGILGLAIISTFLKWYFETNRGRIFVPQI